MNSDTIKGARFVFNGVSKRFVRSQSAWAGNLPILPFPCLKEELSLTFPNKCSIIYNIYMKKNTEYRTLDTGGEKVINLSEYQGIRISDFDTVRFSRFPGERLGIISMGNKLPILQDTGPAVTGLQNKANLILWDESVFVCPWHGQATCHHAFEQKIVHKLSKMFKTSKNCSKSAKKCQF